MAWGASCRRNPAGLWCAGRAPPPREERGWKRGEAGEVEGMAPVELDPLLDAAAVVGDAGLAQDHWI